MSTIEILGRNWLVYMPTSYYIPELVEEFYNGFTKFDISDDLKSIKLHWRGEIHTVHAKTISVITSILLQNGNQIPFTIEEYQTKMGPICTLTRDRSISRKTLYFNIHSTYC